MWESPLPRWERVRVRVQGDKWVRARPRSQGTTVPFVKRNGQSLPRTRSGGEGETAASTGRIQRIRRRTPF